MVCLAYLLAERQGFATPFATATYGSDATISTTTAPGFGGMESTLRDLDDDGYPTAELLERVSKWPYKEGFTGLMELVEANWNWPTYFQQDGNKYVLATGGWSGNEDLIGALQENTMFWVTCWKSSSRGGRYEFELAT